MKPLSVPGYVASICAVLKDAGYEAYAVGGGVRDALLGRAPKDWDVATSAPPEEVQRLFPRTVPTGIEFGTVTVLMNGHAVEVTTFRGESGYYDGRHPESVHFIGSIEDDLVRRDFTINAIAYDPQTNTVVDPHNGRSDLAQRLIRAVGDPNERFREDGLRVLRAVRLAVELRFFIEPETKKAMRRHGGKLLQISRERIGQEWRRMLAAPEAARGLAMLSELELLPYVLPAPAGQTPSAARIVRTIAALDRAPGGSLAVKTALVLYGLGGAELDEYWLRQLVYPRRVMRETLHIVRFMRAFNPDQLKDDAALRRFMSTLGRPFAAGFFEAWRAWRSGKQARLLQERAARILRRGDALAPAELAVDGHDVRQALPDAAGREIGEALQDLLDHVLQHPEDNNRERLLALLAARRPGAR